jgi:hypothetical protein
MVLSLPMLAAAALTLALPETNRLSLENGARTE